MPDTSLIPIVLGRDYKPETYDYTAYRRSKLERKKQEGWEECRPYGADAVIVRRKKEKSRAAQ